MQSNAIEQIRQAELAAAESLKGARAEAEAIRAKALAAAERDGERRAAEAKDAAEREIKAAQAAAENAARRAERALEDELGALRASAAERKPAAIAEILRLIRE